MLYEKGNHGQIYLRQVDNIKQDFVLSPVFFKVYKLIIFTGTLQEEKWNIHRTFVVSQTFF